MYECLVELLLLSWWFECQIVNMLQLKVFYNVSFPKGERCEVIFTDQNIQSFEELMEVV